MYKPMHTLVAYKVNFTYMKQNNPLKEELKEEIENGRNPDVKISDVIKELNSKYYDHKICEESEYILKLATPPEVDEIDKNTKRYYITPDSGRRGRPFKVFDTKTNAPPKEFDDSYASSYKNNIFIYDVGGEYYAIFHRYGHSGCKTIFMDMINAIYNPKGIRINMELILYSADESELDNICPNEITLTKTISIGSSDPADNILKRTKTKEVKVASLTLFLGAHENSNIREIVEKTKVKKMTTKDGLLAIRNEGYKEYNQAKVTLKIGKKTSIVDWEDLENLLNNYDITEEMENSKDQIMTLKRCSLVFLRKILETN